MGQIITLNHSIQIWKTPNSSQNIHYYKRTRRHVTVIDEWYHVTRQ